MRRCDWCSDEIDERELQTSAGGLPFTALCSDCLVAFRQLERGARMRLKRDFDAYALYCGNCDEPSVRVAQVPDGSTPHCDDCFSEGRNASEVIAVELESDDPIEHVKGLRGEL